jgi:hypothetical protein
MLFGLQAMWWNQTIWGHFGWVIEGGSDLCEGLF